MTVAEMLERIGSYELTEWAVYEKMFGPLGRQYGDNQLASIEERLAFLTDVTAKRGSKAQPKNPQHVPRPWELDEDPKHAAHKDKPKTGWNMTEEDAEEE